MIDNFSNTSNEIYHCPCTAGRWERELRKSQKHTRNMLQTWGQLKGEHTTSSLFFLFQVCTKSCCVLTSFQSSPWETNKFKIVPDVWANRWTIICGYSHTSIIMKAESSDIFFLFVGETSVCCNIALRWPSWQRSWWAIRWNKGLRRCHSWLVRRTHLSQRDLVQVQPLPIVPN